MRYVQGKTNRVADALSRLPADIKSSEMHAYEVSGHLKDEEFILPVTKLTNSETDKQMTKNNGEQNVWTTYRIQYESVENGREKIYTLNPDATTFIPLNLKNQEITAPVMSQSNQKKNKIPSACHHRSGAAIESRPERPEAYSSSRQHTTKGLTAARAMKTC